MVKKSLILGAVFMICLWIFAGCGSSLKITNFEGLKDLPRNPTKIIFATNSQNVTDDGIYGEPIEYEVQSEKIVEVTKMLFAISYKAEPKNIKIDMSPITRILTFYNEDGDTWTVRLGLQRHKERWYSPIQDEALIAVLYQSITK